MNPRPPRADPLIRAAAGTHKPSRPDRKETSMYIAEVAALVIGSGLVGGIAFGQLQKVVTGRRRQKHATPNK